LIHPLILVIRALQRSSTTDLPSPLDYLVIEFVVWAIGLRPASRTRLHGRSVGYARAPYLGQPDPSAPARSSHDSPRRVEPDAPDSGGEHPQCQHHQHRRSPEQPGRSGLIQQRPADQRPGDAPEPE